MNQTFKEVSVIIPAFNEEAGIAKVINDIKNVFAKFANYEIIVVDDGSHDKTGTIAASLGAIVLRNPVNMGYGFSLKCGFKQTKYEATIITDADTTYPAEMIPQLLAELEKGFDMVVGKREGQSLMLWGIFKNPARILFKFVSEFVVGKKIPDINSGFRAIRRSKIIPLLGDFSNGFSFSTSSTLIFNLKGYFIGYLPIPYHKRVGRSKVRFLRDTIRTAQILTDIIAHYNPIKLFMLIAFLPFLIFLVFLVVFIFAGNVELLTPIFLSFYASLFLFALGIFADIFRKDL